MKAIGRCLVVVMGLVFATSTLHAQSPPVAGFVLDSLSPPFSSLSDDFLLSLTSTATNNPTATNYLIRSSSGTSWLPLSNQPNPIYIPLTTSLLVNGYGDYDILQVVSNGNGVDSAMATYPISCASLFPPIEVIVSHSTVLDPVSGDFLLMAQIAWRGNSIGFDITFTGGGSTQTFYNQQSAFFTVPSFGHYEICGKIYSGTCTSPGAVTGCDTVFIPCTTPSQPGFNALPTGTTGQDYIFQNTSISNADSSVLTWAWTFGDGGISSQMEPVHTYANPGSYLVCLVSDNGCGFGQLCKTINVITGSEAAGAELFSISPSPANQLVQVRLDLPNQKGLEGRLYDVFGKLVGEGSSLPFSPNNLDLEVSSLPEGVFVLEIQNGNRRAVKKILIQRK